MRNEGPTRQRAMLLRIVATALLLYALAHFTVAQLRLTQTEELAASLTAERDALAAENAALTERLRSGGSRDDLEARARRELGLVRPGELLFLFEDREEN